MNRNGLIDDEIDEAISIIKENDLILYGIFTHFCCSMRIMISLKYKKISF